MSIGCGICDQMVWHGYKYTYGVRGRGLGSYAERTWKGNLAILEIGKVLYNLCGLGAGGVMDYAEFRRHQCCRC